MFNFKHAALGFQLDLRRMGLQDSDMVDPLVSQAADALQELENGDLWELEIGKAKLVRHI